MGKEKKISLLEALGFFVGIILLGADSDIWGLFIMTKITGIVFLAACVWRHTGN